MSDLKNQKFGLLASMLMASAVTCSTNGEQMKDHIFRTYDIRGKVGQSLFIDQAYELGCAIAAYLKDCDVRLKTISVGMDGRTHSEPIKEQLVRGLCDSGLDVIFIGLCTTPVMYFSLHQLPVQAGIMITASHNPAEYNGFKICLGHQSVWGDQLQELKNWYKQGKKIEPETKGAYREHLLVEPYVDWLVDHFDHLRGMDMPVVFDCGNGAAGTVMPLLAQKMNWPNAKVLFAEVDGSYPNHEADPTVKKNMQDLQEAVVKENALFGIGFDGDCDRMGAITAGGYLVPGDHMLALFARPLLEKHPGTPVVCDINASDALSEYLDSLGSKLCLSPCGHSIIKNEMKKNHALLGGELSCHFIFKDRYFGFDDGLYAALRLLEIVKNSDKTFEQLLSVYPQKKSSPGIRIACKEEEKHAIVDAIKSAFEKRSDAQLILIDGVRAQLPYGWGLVRVSNTQAVVTMRFEADDEQSLIWVKKDFYALLLPYFDSAVLKEHFGFKEDE